MELAESVKELESYLLSIGFEGAFDEEHNYLMSKTKEVVVRTVFVNDKPIQQKTNINISIIYIGDGAIDDDKLQGIYVSINGNEPDSFWFSDSTLVSDVKQEFKF